MSFDSDSRIYFPSEIHSRFVPFRAREILKSNAFQKDIKKKSNASQKDIKLFGKVIRVSKRISLESHSLSKMSSMVEDATFERSLGGAIIFKRFLAGNNLSRDGNASAGRLFYFTFRLESCLTQNLNVSV